MLSDSIEENILHSIMAVCVTYIHKTKVRQMQINKYNNLINRCSKDRLDNTKAACAYPRLMFTCKYRSSNYRMNIVSIDKKSLDDR